ncbi:hypothetical protein U0O68_001676 [Salmonella enterica]|nr:hypothetical protein [Salmonella enterica]
METSGLTPEDYLEQVNYFMLLFSEQVRVEDIALKSRLVLMLKNALLGESMHIGMTEIHNSGVMNKMEIVRLHGEMSKLWRRHLLNFKINTPIYMDAIRNNDAAFKRKEEREPSFAVIKINAVGEAKVTKQWLSHLAARADFRMDWRNERRKARRLLGALYYRLDSSSSKNDDNIRLLDGMAFHRNEFHDSVFCRPEWLFFDEEVEKARIEVNLRRGIKQDCEQAKKNPEGR